MRADDQDHVGISTYVQYESAKPKIYIDQSHKKRSSDKKKFYHFCTLFFEIGGVLFWQREHFSSKIG